MNDTRFFWAGAWWESRRDSLYLTNSNLWKARWLTLEPRLTQLIQQKDVILFAIEATESMLRVESSDDEETKTCKLVEALKVVHQLMRKKIISNPRDRIGVMIYNTVWAHLLFFFILSIIERGGRMLRRWLFYFSQEQGSKTDRNQWKSCQFLNDLSDIDAPAIKNLKNLIQSEFQISQFRAPVLDLNWCLDMDLIRMWKWWKTGAIFVWTPNHTT